MLYKSKLFLFSTLLLVFGCKTLTEDFLKVETTSLVFSSQVNTQNVSCSSNAEITAESTHPSWCTATVVDNGKAIVVRAEKNDGVGAEEERMATVIVSAGKAEMVHIEVKQSSQDAEFSVDAVVDGELQFSADAALRLLSVRTNIAYTAVSSEKWCTTMRQAQNLAFNVTRNNDKGERTAMVTITAPGFPEVFIRVIQQGQGLFKDGIKILAIGNSFSWDGMLYLYDMLMQTGTSDNILLVNAYIGGCSLNTHFQNAKNNRAEYTRQKFGPMGVISNSNRLFTLKELIEEDEWDVITLQQASALSGIPETYNTDIDFLIAYVKQHAPKQNFLLGWQMTWAYAANSTNSAFPDYNSNQQEMYDRICNAVKTKIVPRSDFEFIIPAGTAIQNARLLFGDYLTRDGSHLNNMGCYIVSATWLKTITGRDLSELATPYNASATETPVTIDKECLEKIVQSVNAAVEAPFDQKK